MQIVVVHTAAELEEIKQLFRDYFDFLINEHSLDIGYQGIEAELANLPGEYAHPKGRLILALLSDRAVGCAALRPLDEGTCEMKRMYVLPQFRGTGIGKALALALIRNAQEIGYTRMRLDTGTFLTSAIRIYEKLGFKRIEPYNDVPEDIKTVAIFMELDLK